MLKKLINLIKKIFWTSNEENSLYYCGGETLPQPLKQEEELQLYERLKEGDKDVYGTLIERNLRLVVYIARKFENTNVDLEDLISVGTIGLIKSVYSFKYDKNIKLATYASRCIENEILMHLRRTGKQKMEISLDEPLNVDWEGNVLLMSDILGTEPDIVSKKYENDIERKLIWKAIAGLKDREKQIMEMRFGLIDGEEQTQKEVAEKLGISQSYISRLEKKIIQLLKKQLKQVT